MGFETVQGPAENSAEKDKPIYQEIENGKLEQEAEVADTILFGSHGDESAKPEGEVAPDSNVLKMQLKIGLRQSRYILFILSGSGLMTI